MLAAAATSAFGRPLADPPTSQPAQASAPAPIYLPLLRRDPPADDLPLLGAPSGAASQPISWLAARAAHPYTVYDIAAIVAAYQQLGEPAGLDWFLALAQLAHETGHLTSWWSQPPRRNPAGIGVTGRTQPGTPDAPPGWGWTWDGLQWREGLSFPSWDTSAAPAHLGRLLAYALRDEDASSDQRALIDYALLCRPLPDSYRGVAPTICGLNGRWAVPGTTYGQTIVALARQMRGGV